MQIREVIARAGLIACLAGCSGVVQDHAADLGVSGPGNVRLGSPAKIVVSVTPNSDVVQLAIVFADGWLDNNSLLGAGACKPSNSIAGELTCGPLKAGHAAKFALTAIAKKAGSNAYSVAVRDVGSTGTDSQPVLKDANGIEAFLHFTEVVT